MSIVGSPRIELSELINQTTAQIELVDRKIRTLATILPAYDDELKNKISLAQDVAQAQLSVIAGLIQTRNFERNFVIANRVLEEKLDAIREDYIVNFRSLLQERDWVFEEAKTVPLSEEKKNELVQQFTQKINERLTFCKEEFPIDEKQNLYLIERLLKEREEMREPVFFKLFDEWIEHQAEYRDLEPKIASLNKEKLQLQSQLQVKDIYTAAQLGDVDFLKKELNKPGYVNSLRGAFNKLLSNGPIIDQRDGRGFTALEIAAYCNQLGAVDFFLKNGANPLCVVPGGNQALHWAAEAGAHIAAEKLISSKAKINAPGINDRTPLHHSVWRNKFKVTRLLLERGADINAQADKDAKVTPLHCAVQCGNAAMVQLLCESSKLNPNLKNDKDWVPLRMAVEDDFLEIMRMISSHKNFWNPSDPHDPNSLEMLKKNAKSEEAKNIIEDAIRHKQ